eukprot:TRINITY_DN3906_c0_g1_i1.p1 TRINITY_DN3906_c0_g1~~TRINITY_DN3906_c0_g1_i1.p1  ORF type:complete len:866 (+),score=176.39 TRINITY_DN3906_c0_g1_i1:102-2699(+)
MMRRLTRLTWKEGSSRIPKPFKSIRYKKHNFSTNKAAFNSLQYPWIAGCGVVGGAVIAAIVVQQNNTDSNRSEASQQQLMIGETKPKETVDLIRRGLRTNRLMRLLDVDQEDTLIRHMYRKEFEGSSYLLRAGEEGGQFYVLECGECEVLREDANEGYPVRELTPGEGFGEGSLIFSARRSASVKAKTKVTCWVIDRETFTEVVLPSSVQLKAAFENYASVRDGGRVLMTDKDFFRSMNLPGHEPHDEQRYRYLFEIADQSRRGLMTFEDFALFTMIASQPNAEFDLAFRLFDTKNVGLVGKEDVLAIISRNKAPELESGEHFHFDSESNLMVRFFGADGSRRLHATEFSQFFVNLTEEIPRQIFRFYDQNKRGYITSDQFVELLAHFGSFRLPDGISERLVVMKSLNNNKIITYGELMAFNSFLNHLPAFGTIVRDSCKELGRPLTKDEFTKRAQSVASNVSPLEVDIVFAIFDLNRDGLLSHKNFKSIHDVGDEPVYDLSTFDKTKAKNKKKENGNGHTSSFQYFLESIEHFAFGAVAGGIGATSVYPIDLVKTRMQNQRAVGISQRLYANSIDCFMKVVKGEGVFGLYRGLVPQLIGVAPEKAIKLTVNDLIRKLTSDANGNVSLPFEILAGGSAGCSQVIFTNPLEIVKIRLQVQGEHKKHDPNFLPKNTWTIVKELGISGLYKGVGACLLRDIPFSAIYFPTYAAAKRWLSDPTTGEVSAWNLLLAGSLAGVPAASLVTPADVIKTRLQVEARKGQSTYSGILDCAQKVYQQEGFKALWKGAGARVLRSSPQFGITLLSYEMIQRTLAPNLVGRKSPPPFTPLPVSSDELETFRRSMRGSSLLKTTEKVEVLTREGRRKP